MVSALFLVYVCKSFRTDFATPDALAPFVLLYESFEESIGNPVLSILFGIFVVQFIRKVSKTDSISNINSDRKHGKKPLKDKSKDDNDHKQGFGSSDIFKDYTDDVPFDGKTKKSVQLILKVDGFFRKSEYV